ncbi:MAG: SDR family NAD(P)-dependent oxidoreductase [Henriciella sp.]
MALDREGANSSPRRVVIVTGAGKGLGRAFAIACAQQGDAVIVNNRRREGESDSAKNVVDEIRALGGAAVAERSDVTALEAPQGLLDAALSNFGRLDAVILNAGVAGAPDFFGKVAAEKFDHVIETNFNAQVRLVRTFLPVLKTAPAGRLVFIASSAGMYGMRGGAAYSASKGAVIAFASALAAENRKSPLRVNTLAPYAETRMTHDTVTGEIAERFSPQAAAAPAAWLASEDCRQTGQLWVAGAGQLRHARMVEAATEAFSGSLPVPIAGIEMHPETTMSTYDDAERAFADFVARTEENAKPTP